MYRSPLPCSAVSISRLPLQGGFICGSVCPSVPEEGVSAVSLKIMNTTGKICHRHLPSTPCAPRTPTGLAARSDWSFHNVKFWRIQPPAIQPQVFSCVAHPAHRAVPSSPSTEHNSPHPFVECTNAPIKREKAHPIPLTSSHFVPWLAVALCPSSLVPSGLNLHVSPHCRVIDLPCETHATVLLSFSPTSLPFIPVPPPSSSYLSLDPHLPPPLHPTQRMTSHPLYGLTEGSFI